MQLQIRVYGPLRTHMPQRFPLESDERLNGRLLLDRLCQMYPPAAPTLKSCRIATGNTILDQEAILGEGEVSLLPPSSGG